MSDKSLIPLPVTLSNSCIGNWAQEDVSLASHFRWESLEPSSVRVLPFHPHFLNLTSGLDVSPFSYLKKDKIPVFRPTSKVLCEFPTPILQLDSLKNPTHYNLSGGYHFPDNLAYHPSCLLRIPPSHTHDGIHFCIQLTIQVRIGLASKRHSNRSLSDPSHSNRRATDR